MSFNNYYPVYEVKKEFDVLLAIWIAVGIVAVTVILWYLYGLNYRYSSERIADRLSKKYNKPIAADQTLIATDGKLFTDGQSNFASAEFKISSRDLETTKPVTYSLPVVEGCSPIDKTCVSF